MWLFYNQDLGAGFFSLRLKIVMAIYFLQYLIKSWMQLYKHVFYVCDPIRTNCDPFLSRNPSDENRHIREF